MQGARGADLSPALEGTPLYSGVVACCGRGAFGVGCSVTDSAPADDVRASLREWARSAGGARTEALVLQAFDRALERGSGAGADPMLA